MDKNTHIIYMLENDQGKRYIGFTANLEQRICNHNAEKSRFTKSKGPWKLKWKSKTMSATEARKLELLMKRQKGGGGLQHLLTIYADEQSQ